jgi:hypothetical protein
VIALLKSDLRNRPSDALRLGKERLKEILKFATSQITIQRILRKLLIEATAYRAFNKRMLFINNKFQYFMKSKTDEAAAG